MKMKSLVLHTLTAGALACLACTSNDVPSATGTPSAADSGVVEDSGGSADAGPQALTPTRKTALVAAFGSARRTFERAQFGTEKSDGGEARFYVEAYAGGAPECPSPTSPEPERILIVSGVPRGVSGQSFTKADGVSAALVDLAGNLIEKPTASATAVTATIAEISAGGETVELEVDARFAEGTIVGRIYAEFCQSLSK
jgi:hypothetical protein